MSIVNLKNIIEKNSYYYHGSDILLPVGTVLKPNLDYEKNWSKTDFYKPLELYRPSGMLSHSESVFMCDNEDDIDLCGGATEYLFTVFPHGIIQKHDLNWSSEISCLIGDGYDIESEEIKNSASNYWNGVPHRDENVWEFLTPSAIIIKAEKY